MKKAFTLLVVAILLTINTLAQEQNYGGMITQNEDGTFFYMRSSLEMVYIESEDFPNKDLVDASWNQYMDPDKNFPNQYNKHGVDFGSVSLGPTKELNNDGKLVDVKDKVMKERITQYIADNKIANQLIMRWFDYNPDGTVNYDIDYPENPNAKISMQTIFDRGYYTVNAGDENVSMSALKRDKDTQIKDLSMKLIPFTFMTFTKFDFYENEPVARAIRDAAIIVADAAYANSINNGTNKTVADLIHASAIAAANGAYNATKDGYTLKSDTWLYKLVWNEETELYFNNEVIKNPRLLETSNRFRMEYVDHQENRSTVLISATRTFSQIIDLTMVRNLNKVFEQLQIRNDVFKVWTPLLDFYSLVSPRLSAPITVEGKTITAKIGVKEGLRGGEQFSVVDEDGNFYGYVIAQKGMIWDNDEGVGDDAADKYEPQVNKKKQPVTATTFKAKGLKKAHSGLLIENPMPPKKMRVAARVGTKEGIEDNDKFDVYLYDAMSDKLNKIGTMKVVKGKVWNNIYYNNNETSALTGVTASEVLKKRDKDGLRVTETLFKGNCKVQPGMFLRKTK